MNKFNFPSQTLQRFDKTMQLSCADACGIKEEMACVESEVRSLQKINNQSTVHWYDPVPRHFTAEQREHTTVLFAGLTIAHDRFIEAALKGLGYRVKALDCPDNKALNFGKEFGNRGQCNPTYFTVGNLLKYLHHLRDVNGISISEIIENYIFITAGSCGPCRFGMYVTEFRKALRDAGFDGFRVLLFQQTGGLKQATGMNNGLVMDALFFRQIIKAEIAGDVLNALGYRIRPYEVKAGETDIALQRCHQYVCTALLKRRSVLRALWRCHRELNKIIVDRMQPKPRVAIIGEFWAMTTEGDGNYQLQRFLESEGAEVDIQLMTSWILFLIWERRYDIKRREDLKGFDNGQINLEKNDPRKLSLKLWIADKIIRIVFQIFARAAGLKDYHLPDMDLLAGLAHRFYDNHLRGGEGHLEVGEVIFNVTRNKVNMTVSVKPFGCMPSSGISDGIQSLISEIYPRTIFLPVETTGDGAVNVYSRIQMQLFKAKKAALQEITEAYAVYHVKKALVKHYLQRHPNLQLALHRSPHRAGSTNADLVHEVGCRIRCWRILRKWILNLIRKSKMSEQVQVIYK